jgi:uncharacterized HAD superfamily protein
MGRTFFPKILQQWTLSQPLQDDIHIARELATKHTVSIITARPQGMEQYTDQWLRTVANIPYHKLYCVGLEPGFGERKLQIAQKIKLDLFLDDTPSTIHTFHAAGMEARLFQSWKDFHLVDDELNT